MTDTFHDLEPRDLERLPVFPLGNAVLFPGALMPLHIFEPRYRDMIRDVLAGNRKLAIARLRPGFEENYYGRPEVFDVCGAGVIVEDSQRPDGKYDIVVRGLARVRLCEELPPTQAYRLFRAERLHDRDVDIAALAAWHQQLARLWADLRPHLPPKAGDLRALLEGTHNAGASADRIAEALVADPDDRQLLLEELDPSERYSRLITRLDELVSALVPNRTQSGDLN